MSKQGDKFRKLAAGLPLSDWIRATLNAAVKRKSRNRAGRKSAE
jgi:hypothetical protein